MVQLTDKGHWAVEMPDSSGGVEIMFTPSIDDMLNDISGDSELIIWYTARVCGSPRKRIVIDLPELGTWQFLFTTKEVKKEQWMQVVDSIDSEGRGLVFMNYCNGMYVFSNAKSSGRSLLRSQGCDENNNWAIIQKQTTNGTE